MSTDSITIAEPLRLWANLVQAQTALERARAAVPLAGDKARAWSRITIDCGSASEVDAIAAQWGVRPRWNAEGSHYSAECKVGAAATEAVYYGQRDEQDTPAQAASAA
jgi:hypothetical protein